MKHSRLGHIYAGICILIWGSVLVATKLLLQKLTPFDILWWRFCIGYLFLWILYPHPVRIKSIKHELYFAVGGLFGVHLYFVFQNVALTMTGAGDVSIIISLIPMVTALVMQNIHRRKETGIQFYAGFCLAVSGTVMVCSQGLQGGRGLSGDLLVFLAVLCWSVYTVVSERLSESGYPSLGLIRRCFFYGLLSMLPEFLVWKTTPIHEVWSVEVAVPLLFMGIAASALAYVFWNLAIERIGAVKTNLYMYALPVITIGISCIVLREQITPISVLGIVLTLAGLGLSEYKGGRDMRGEKKYV